MLASCHKLSHICHKSWSHNHISQRILEKVLKQIIVRAESNGLYLFSFALIFISFYFLLFSILELRVRVMCDVTVMLSYISYIHIITYYK